MLGMYQAYSNYMLLCVCRLSQDLNLICIEELCMHAVALCYPFNMAWHRFHGSNVKERPICTC
jgi:hypothetical protein